MSIKLIFVSLIFVALLFYENILTTKFSQITVYETGFSCIIYDYIYTYRVSSDISHGRIKAAVDTNLLEVARFSETACTSVTCNRLNSIRMRLLAYCCLNAIQKQCWGYTQTTTKGDNYHKAKLSPWEMHWQTLLRSLVYIAISSEHRPGSWSAPGAYIEYGRNLDKWSVKQLRATLTKFTRQVFIMTWRMQKLECTYVASSVTW